MTVNVSRIKTTRFLDAWAYFPALISFVLFLLIFGAPFFAQILVNKKVQVTEEEPVKVDTFVVKPSDWGAFRVDVQADFPLNHWVIYEIQLVDKNGKVIASAMDEAWRESGTWYEDGESGKWQESDRLGGFDFRSPEPEELDLIIEVLESGTTSGQARDLTVSFDVDVTKHVVNRNYLGWGLFFSSGLSIMALVTTSMSGEKAISKNTKNSDLSDRTVVGGKDSLVRVKIKAKVNRNSPNKIKFNLAINNAYGEIIYQNSYSDVSVMWRKVNGTITGGIGNLDLFFILEPRSSYGFQVSILPDDPVTQTFLVVRDGAKNLNLEGVEVVYLRPNDLSGNG